MLSLNTLLSSVIVCSTVVSGLFEEPNFSPVIIIGGGASGIAAAERLHSEGVEFVVLEAEPRIGGRMKKMEWGGITVEMGPNWIAGGSSNYIYWDAAQELDIAGGFTDWSDYKMIDYNGTQSEVVPKSIATSIQNKFYRLFYHTCSRRSRVLKRKAKRGGEDLDISVAKCLQDNGVYDNKGSLETRVLDHWMWDSIDLEYTVDEERLGLMNAFPINGDMEEELFMVNDPRGFAHILESMSEPFNNKIFLNTKVDTVQHGKHGVSVTTTDGTVFTADFVISTISVGAMQNRVVQFVPDLSAEKWGAFDKAIMGSFTKIFIQFESKFWDAEILRLTTTLASTSDPLAPAAKYGWAMSLDEPKYQPGSRALMFVLVGDEGREAETRDVEEIKAEIVANLQLHYPDITIPPVVGDVLVADWSSNPLFGGAYSVWPVGFSDAEFKRLRKAEGRVFFAGEHTAAVFTGYVHGAMQSGHVAARRAVRRLSRRRRRAARHGSAKKDD